MATEHTRSIGCSGGDTHGEFRLFIVICPEKSAPYFKVFWNLTQISKVMLKPWHLVANRLEICNLQTVFWLACRLELCFADQLDICNLQTNFQLLGSFAICFTDRLEICNLFKRLNDLWNLHTSSEICCKSIKSPTSWSSREKLCMFETKAP